MNELDEEIRVDLQHDAEEDLIAECLNTMLEHAWQDAGGDMEICALCGTERWADS